MHRDSEEALIRDCQLGDRTALETLVRRYERPVFNAAYRMLGNADEAVDVSQTAFLKVIENLSRFDPKFRFFSWIYRITLNEAIDRINQRKRERPLGDVEKAGPASPQDEVDAKQKSKEVQAVLMELSDEHRAVIVLRYFTDASYREIAAILEVPEKTVKSRLFGARRQMKQHLCEHGIYEA